MPESWLGDRVKRHVKSGEPLPGDGCPVVRYEPLRCPNPKCRSDRIKTTHTLPWELGVRRRYHRCLACRIRFRSDESKGA